MEDKFCVNCKYYKYYKFGDTVERLCYSPRLGRSLVTGEQIHMNCQDVRSDGEDMCGENGSWFAPKE